MELRLENITKSFGDKTVLKGFSHVFKDGSITALCGESGCGKTTLLRLIAGLDKYFEGKISPEKYSVSVAFQEHRLYPGATVLENVKVASDSPLTAELLLELGIGKESFDALPSELSGGMARRVSLARALLKDADVYLIDEPFAGLDEDNAQNTARILERYLKGKTAVVVTHNKELASLFANDFLYL